MSIQLKIKQRKNFNKLDKENTPAILYTKVLALLSKRSNLTVREIAKGIGRNNKQDIQLRLTELLNKGLIIENEKSNRKVNTYSLRESTK